MSPQTITVHSRVFGNPAPELVLQPVLVEVHAQHLTVADLIRRTVAAQVADLRAREGDGGRCPQQTLDLHYRPQAEFVARHIPEDGRRPTVTVEAAQEQAIRGFEQRAYLVLIDGEQVERLDDLVVCSPQTQATFLRLLPLVGG